ncbi:endo-1,4-beta-xylanase [candidate division KSB1 bacterium]|nr:endo-1,4-beta-xylanase [candidate division KSB1 bacterium]
MKILTTVIITLLLTALAASQTDPKYESFLQIEREKLPVAGQEIYNGGNMGTYRFGGGSGATRRIVDADPELPFGKVLQLSIQGAGANPWEPQMQTPENQVDVNTGDYLFYIFYIRALESAADNGFGQATFYVQRSSSPWTGLGSLTLSIRPSWQKYYVLARAGENFPKGEMEVTIHLGYVKQKIEISGIIGLNLGSDIDPADLPQTPIYYDGMDTNAAWRAEAQSRIRNHRMGDLTVKVKNSNGEAVQNALVTVRMTNHAYGFGTFMAELALQSTPNAQNYIDHVFELFNRATTPFYMGGNTDDWGWYGSSGHSKSAYPQLAEWLQDNNIPTKGHVLIWPGWDWMPSFFEGLKDNPAELRQAIDDHLQEIVPIGEQYGLVEWDVVNEPYYNHDVMDILGDDILIEWYNRVHEIDPNPRLILNEYNILAGGGKQDFQDNLARVIELLQNGGAPIGGIGMQCHFDANLTGIPRVLEILDRFGQYGLPIQITEFDIDIYDEEIQAAYTRDFYTAVFSHPATDKIVMWGFWEGDMWRPKGALIRTDWSYKKNYDAYTDLLFKQWWTDTDGFTNRDGIFSVRGFLGEYSLRAEFDGVTDSKRAVLTQDGIEIELVVPTTATEIESGAKNPVEHGLKPNHPNPFNASTVIEFTPKSSGNAILYIYDVRGTEVLKKCLAVKRDVPQREKLTLDGLASGSYFYMLAWPDGTREKRKMMLLR